ncbi:MAG: 50S ribosomal protein L23 [Lentisphaerae bacterium ADurb.BinA184]|nr:MAG: 50S ribosomal protein L23 [Lentisphaerae bacterium ADurb.BinA184]
MNNPYAVIQTVLVTERATDMAERNCYAMRVAPGATKTQIRQAVEAIFNVKVARVNTLNQLGKKKRQRTARYGRRPNWKKAMVTLREGKIEII